MTPNDDTRDEELLARYRQASADATGPSDAVRAAILAEGRRVADELAKRAPPTVIDVSRPAANDARWKITAFGTVGAALLAALLFAPRYRENTPPANESTASVQASKGPAPAAAPPAAPPARAAASEAAPTPKLEGAKPPDALSYTAPARSKSAGAPTLNLAAPVHSAPLSAAQNYAPGPPSAAPPASNLAAAPPPAAQNRMSEPSAQAEARDRLFKRVEGGAAADSARADSALKPATLDSAVAQGDVAQAASLLDQGAAIDARDQAGRTPLMLAVTQDRLELVRLLLARGADPNAADNAGNTPLQQATKRNLQDVAELLERAGAH